jgi:hypothetical protein
MSDGDFGWVLAVPFTVASALRLCGETSETLNGVTVRVRPAIGGYNEFLFEGLDSVEQARQQFEALRTGTLAASLYIGGGVRVGRDLVELDENAALPSDPGQAMVYPRGRSLSRLILHVSEPEFQTEKVFPRFMEGLLAGLTARAPRQAMQDPKVRLAGTLYTESYFEASPQAQFIGFIGVLEVLKDQELRSTAVNELIVEVSKIDIDRPRNTVCCAASPW